MVAKIQALAKTVRAEYKIVVADLHVQSRAMTGSGAARVGDEEVFVSADATITTQRKVTLQNIRKVVVIQAWKPVFISLKNETGSIENIPCVDVFMMYGALDEITIRAQNEGDAVRISYIHA